MTFMIAHNNNQLSIFFSPRARLITDDPILPFLEDGYKAKWHRQGSEDFPFPHVTLRFKENPKFPVEGKLRFPRYEDDFILCTFNTSGIDEFRGLPVFRRSPAEMAPRLTPYRTGVQFPVPKIRRY